MEINKKKTVFNFIIVNLILIGISFGLYFAFMKTFEKKYIENHINANQHLIANKVDNELQTLISLFDEKTEGKVVSELNDDLTVDDDLIRNGFIEFVETDGIHFTYDSKTINILNSQANPDYVFGFFRNGRQNNLFIFSDDVVAIIDFNKTFKDIIVSTDANDVFIMSNNGTMFYNSNRGLYKPTLDSYLTEGTGKYEVDLKFPLVVDSVDIHPIVNDKEAVILFTKIAGFESIYLAQQFYRSDINAEFMPLNLFILSMFMIMMLLNLIIVLFIFYLLNKKNSDIENAKLKHYYDKPYILRIDKKGNVLKRNRRFRIDFPSTDIKTVSQFFISEQNILEKIKRGTLIKYMEDNKTIGFIPIKINRGFYLVGDFLRQDLSASNEAHNLAYYSQVTGLGNKHLFGRQLGKLLEELYGPRERTIYLMGLQIREYQSLQSYLNQITLNSMSKKLAETLVGLVDMNIKDTEIYQYDEEVIILVFKNTVIREVESLFAKIEKHLEKPLELPEAKVDVRLAGAIMPVTNHNYLLTPDLILDLVLETLRRSKIAQTKSYLMFDETIIHSLTEKEQLKADLVTAIEKKEFIPYLQPQYDYREDRIIGFEALMRWDNPKYFNKSPMMFIEVAEQAEILNEISKIMMDKTFAAARDLQEFGVTVSINVTANQLLGQGFTEELLKMHKSYNLKENSIAIEITESTLIKSFRVANDKIKILKRNGIRVDLDDFGTGYSSLPYIKELNFDAIKIDKMFIDDVETDKYDRAIVQMILELGKTLNASVIAEGIETLEQMNYLVDVGCYIIQGYYISRPVPVDEAKVLIEEYNIEKTKSFRTPKEEPKEEVVEETDETTSEGEAEEVKEEE